jgi:hypothetical protein
MVRSWQAAAVAAAAAPRRSEARRFPDRAGFSAKALGEFNGDCDIWNENAGDGCDPSCGWGLLLHSVIEFWSRTVLKGK